MGYRPTIKQIRAELEALGGWLEVLRDTERPEYAPHLSREERGWPHGLWFKDELIEWAKETNLI